MRYLPNEILDIIFSYVERPKHTTMIKYLIDDCYEKDVGNFFGLLYKCSKYHTFNEWYYLYREEHNLGGSTERTTRLKKIFKYKNTPIKLIIHKKYKNTPNNLECILS